VVKIRMKMMGRKHRPFFRICAIDSRRPRDGRPIEELGTYDPMVPETEKRYAINKERAEYWLSVGAQPSDRVAVLLKKAGVALPVRKKKKRKGPADTPAKKA
jgi:small subunit ribosomal protein S16